MAHTIPKNEYFLNFFLFVIFFIVLHVAEGRGHQPVGRVYVLAGSASWWLV